MDDVKEQLAKALSAFAGDSLERTSRQEILNVALYRIIEAQGGSITLHFDVLNAKGMGGIGVELDPTNQTATFGIVTDEQANAMRESETNEKH